LGLGLELALGDVNGFAVVGGGQEVFVGAEVEGHARAPLDGVVLGPELALDLLVGMRGKAVLKRLAVGMR
jgi:hypothetical protein